MKYKFVLFALLLSGSLSAFGQETVLDESVNETVQLLTKKGLFDISLETTIFKPDGAGPFPIAVINHGKASGDPISGPLPPYFRCALFFAARLCRGGADAPGLFQIRRKLHRRRLQCREQRPGAG